MFIWLSSAWRATAATCHCIASSLLNIKTNYVQVSLSCTVFAVEEENKLFSTHQNLETSCLGQGVVALKTALLQRTDKRWVGRRTQASTERNSSCQIQAKSNCETSEQAWSGLYLSLSLVYNICMYAVCICMHIAISPCVHSIEGAGVEKCKSRQWSNSVLIQPLQMPRNRFPQSNKAAPMS